jgi:hypothetical protein
MSETKQLTPPKAQSITARNIQDAYLHNSQRQQRRIESYGRANRRFYKTLRPSGPAQGNS